MLHFYLNSFFISKLVCPKVSVCSIAYSADVFFHMESLNYQRVWAVILQVLQVFDCTKKKKKVRKIKTMT